MAATAFQICPKVEPRLPSPLPALDPIVAAALIRASSGRFYVVTTDHDTIEVAAARRNPQLARGVLMYDAATRLIAKRSHVRKRSPLVPDKPKIVPTVPVSQPSHLALPPTQPVETCVELDPPGDHEGRLVVAATLVAALGAPSAAEVP